MQRRAHEYSRLWAGAAVARTPPQAIRHRPTAGAGGGLT